MMSYIVIVLRRSQKLLRSMPLPVTPPYLSARERGNRALVIVL